MKKYISIIILVLFIIISIFLFFIISKSNNSQNPMSNVNISKLSSTLNEDNTKTNNFQKEIASFSTEIKDNSPRKT